MKKLLAICAAAALALGIAGCANEDATLTIKEALDTTRVTAEAVEVQSNIVVKVDNKTASAATIKVGQTITVSANYKDDITYTSEDETVASVVADTGVVTGKKIGETVIYVNYKGNGIAGIALTVEKGATITGGDKVFKGGTLTLTAAGGTIKSWASSDTTKATVGANGVVTGVAAGKATITATVDIDGEDVTATKEIEVVTSISYSLFKYSDEDAATLNKTSKNKFLQETDYNRLKDSQGIAKVSVHDGGITFVSNGKEKWSYTNASLSLSTGNAYTAYASSTDSDNNYLYAADSVTSVTLANYIIIKAAAATVPKIEIPYTVALATKDKGDAGYVDKTIVYLALAKKDGTIIAKSAPFDASKGTDKGTDNDKIPAGTVTFTNVQSDDGEIVLFLLRSQGTGGFSLTTITQSTE